MCFGEGKVSDALIGAHEEVDRMKKTFGESSLGLLYLYDTIGSLERREEGGGEGRWRRRGEGREGGTGERYVRRSGGGEDGKDRGDGNREGRGGGGGEEG